MISVLMSVYNEKLEEIRQSINSILEQTYDNYELIVVLDNPTYEEAVALLVEFAAKDSRVKIIKNEKNIGLAMSMNVAAAVAQGEFLLRMDADDVCMSDRFAVQWDAMQNGNYDLVCGNYDYIDEDGNLLNMVVPLYSDKQINRLLPHRNIIHHPTVMMRADKFREVGGYRNYKCAQDYDLWLRMKNAGYTMHMVPQKLIKYRIRSTSITVGQRYKQACTLQYIHSLYRKSNSMEGYSYEGYQKYLTEHKAEDPFANQDYSEKLALYQSSKKNIKQGHILKGFWGLFRVTFCSKYYKPHYFKSIKLLLLKKFTK